MNIFIVKNDVIILEVFESREKAIQYITSEVDRFGCRLEQDDYGFYAMGNEDWCHEEFYIIEKEVK